jgi:hypothetical protein
MPKKKKSVAGPSTTRAWTPAELSTLKRKFATNTNRDLAEMLDRGIKSIIWQAANLGLKKSAEHRSANSRRTALATLTPEHMRAIGSIGGTIGGKARAESLSAAARKKIAKAAINVRWAKPESK